MLAHEPGKAAAELTKLIGVPNSEGPDGSYLVQTAPDRAAIGYLDRATARQWYPTEWLGALREEGGLAVSLEVGDVDAAARETDGAVLDTGSRVSVAPERTNGVILNFAA